MFSSGTLQISGITIRNNSSTFDGGGIHVDGGVARIGRSTIAANQAQRNGGGISVSGGDVILFESTVGGETTAEGNRAGQFTADGTQGLGGGAFVRSNVGARFEMFGGTIGSNIARISGGGIATLASDRPEGIPDSRSVVFQLGVNVTANRALAADGGGIYNGGAHLELRDSVFAENTARNGAGIFAESGSSINLLGSEIRQNVARRTGGGIFDRGVLRLIESDVSDNQATFHTNIFEA